MTDPGASSWRVRTGSGETFVWQGDPKMALNMVAAASDNSVLLLECVGGTLVNLRHVESFTPRDGL